jgi:hypothetical protein
VGAARGESSNGRGRRLVGITQPRASLAVAVLSSANSYNSVMTSMNSARSGFEQVASHAALAVSAVVISLSSHWFKLLAPYASSSWAN